MSNLQFLQMDVNSMAWWLFLNRQASKSDTMDDFARRTLKPDLLASLSLGVRKKEGLDNRGIWITGSFSRGRCETNARTWRGLARPRLEFLTGYYYRSLRFSSKPQGGHEYFQKVLLRPVLEIWIACRDLR